VEQRYPPAFQKPLLMAVRQPLDLSRSVATGFEASKKTCFWNYFEFPVTPFMERGAGGPRDYVRITVGNQCGERVPCTEDRNGAGRGLDQP
jgi:hypothetical protein